jgi:hypothetical protein
MKEGGDKKSKNHKANLPSDVSIAEAAQKFKRGTAQRRVCEESPGSQIAV